MSADLIEQMLANGESFAAFDAPRPRQVLTPQQRGFMAEAELVECMAARGWWAGLLQTPCGQCMALPTTSPSGCCQPGRSQPTVEVYGQLFHGSRLAYAFELFSLAVES